MSEWVGVWLLAKANPPRLLTGRTAVTVLYAGASDVDGEFPSTDVGHQIFCVARAQVGRFAVSCVSVTHHPQVLPGLKLTLLFMLRDLCLSSSNV